MRLYCACVLVAWRLPSHIECALAKLRDRSLGSASLISDYNGDEYQRIEYTPYGETWVEKTSNTGMEYLPYKFTAKELDEETGLYYYGARYLDPKYSRWISTDPALGEYIPATGKATADEIGNLSGVGGAFNSVNLNLYHYASNNPIKYVDPDGEVAVAVPVVLGLIALYAVLKTYNDNSNSFWSNSSSRGIIGDGLSGNADFAKNKRGNSAKPSPLPNNGAAAAAGSPAPNGNNDNDDGDEKDYYESNPKHHQNAKGNVGREPKNVKEMFDKSVKDPKKNDTRWYKDKSGTLHRFMEHEKHKYHWNGSYEGKASQMDGNVQKLYRSLPKGDIDACW